MYRNNYLMHYGVKGMKWGVRRYQNSDGSLTSAGKTRYKYGDVTVKKTNFKDADSYYISKNGKQVEVSTRSLRNMEKYADEGAIRVIASVSNISTKKARKRIESNKEYTDAANELVDKYMNTKLSDLVEQYGTPIENKKKQTKSLNNSTPKPKYTQQQAIEKGYKDLEKKYPNFNNFTQEKQDRLWMEYMNSSGLYKYT